ncbi:MAG: BTAD domain-containing putative transcriptional regulator [Gemmatimonadaceae bacterium]
MLLQGRSELDALDGALEHLRERSRADVCELFLAASGDREVFLVSHQGADVDAFCRRDRFGAGEGFPGMVLSHAVSLITDQLPAEREFLRARAKALGYTAVLCTPLGPGTDVPGSLLLAWKKPPRDMASALRLAALASVPIGTAIDLMRAHLRMRQLRYLASHDGEPMEGNDQPILHLTDAEAHAPKCPAQRTRQVQVLGGRMGWPTRCREAGCTVPARYCIPLQQDARVWAVATVAFRDSPPSPHTRHLPAALWLTEDLSPSGTHAAAPARVTVTRPIPETRLRIRCFGGLSIALDGRPVERSQMGRQKARELLALLIASSGRPRPLEYLAEQLWPNVPLQRARNRFHVTLSALRRAIEPDGTHGALHIRRDGVRYSLDPDSAVFVDLWHFQQLLREAAVAARPIERSLGLLEEAVSLYSGEVFAGEFTGGWQDGFAVHVRGQALRAVADLAEAKLRCGQVSQALAVLARADGISSREARADPRLLMLRSTCMQRQTPLSESLPAARRP